MAVKIAVANQKGGVSKSTLAVNVAAVLRKLGFRVLLVDGDSQASASDTVGAEFEGRASLYDVLFDGLGIREAVQECPVCDVVPGDSLLREAEGRFSGDASLIGVLRQKVEAVDNEYDFILIDCAPTLGSLLLSCLLAADSVLIPVLADRYSVMGISQLADTLGRVNAGFGKNITVAGLVVSRFNGRLNVSKGILDTLEGVADKLHTRVFDTKIREAAAVKEAQVMRRSVIDYSPRSAVASDFENLTSEILEVFEYGKR